MSTIVFQSYRTHDVRAWIERCLASVREWARGAGHAYAFLDDRLFDYLLPPWYSAAVDERLLPRTNLAVRDAHHASQSRATRKRSVSSASRLPAAARQS